MMGLFDRIASVFRPSEPTIPTVNVDDLPSASLNPGYRQPRYDYQYYNGEKFPGGMGPVKVYDPDYWTLRRYSSQLFRDNLYAAGLIKRLITNEINTGLTLNATPIPELIDTMDEEGLVEWAEDVEQRWKVYADYPQVCDYLAEDNMGSLQRYIRQESLIDGDILMVLRYDPRTGQDRVQLIRGEYVRTSLAKAPANGNSIEYGVEVDKDGRHVAYWVQQEGKEQAERLPAYGTRTGRRIAWLVYGTRRRYGETRGIPLLSLFLQSLKEIDRYRDSAQRKAVINSMLAMYITKTEDKMGSKPLTGAGIRRDSVAVESSNEAPRNLNFSSMLPGVILDELQQGEEPKGFRPDGTDINFAAFEAAMIQSIAWASEMPAEILTLAFSNNYSASQAAINEFKIYLQLARADFTEQTAKRQYYNWMYNELVAGRIQAQGLLENWRNPKAYQEVGAWLQCDWSGAIKPSTDVVKQTKGYEALLGMGLITYTQAARETTGSSFRSVVRQQKRERELLADAKGPDAPPEPGQPAAPNGDQDELVDAIEDRLAG